MKQTSHLKKKQKNKDCSVSLIKPQVVKVEIESRMVAPRDQGRDKREVIEWV